MILAVFARVRLALAILAVVCVHWTANAQQNTGVPNALQGFSQNRDKPVQIEAAQLEVRDKDKVAVFTGNVVVIQGDTTMRCKSLHVFYDQEETKGAPKSSMKAAQPGPGGKQTIRRLEARGGVLVTQKEQTATGAIGIFEMKTNTVTLDGGVVVSQGTNVLRGERLVVDLTTGHAKVEAGKGKPVSGIFSTNSADKPGETSGKNDKPGAGQKPAPKSKPLSGPGN